MYSFNVSIFITWIILLLFRFVWHVTGTVCGNFRRRQAVTPLSCLCMTLEPSGWRISNVVYASHIWVTECDCDSIGSTSLGNWRERSWAKIIRKWNQILITSFSRLILYCGDNWMAVAINARHHYESFFAPLYTWHGPHAYQLNSFVRICRSQPFESSSHLWNTNCTFWQYWVGVSYI